MGKTKYSSRSRLKAAINNLLMVNNPVNANGPKENLVVSDSSSSLSSSCQYDSELFPTQNKTQPTSVSTPVKLIQRPSSSSPNHRPKSPLGNVSARQICNRLNADGCVAKEVKIADLTHITDWNSFFSGFTRSSRDGRCVMVLDGTIDEIRKAVSESALRTSFNGFSEKNQFSGGSKSATVDAALQTAISLSTIPGASRLAMFVLCCSISNLNNLNLTESAKHLNVGFRSLKRFVHDMKQCDPLHWRLLLMRKPRSPSISRLHSKIAAKLDEITYTSASLTRFERKTRKNRSAYEMVRCLANRQVSRLGNHFASSGAGLPASKPRRPIHKISHPVQYLPSTSVETYKDFFKEICSFSTFLSYLKARPWFKESQLRTCLCDPCSLLFFNHMEFLCSHFESLVLALENLPEEFIRAFSSYSSNLDAVSVGRTVRNLLKRWTGHLYAIPMESCKDVAIASHCPKFMLGCPCDRPHDSSCSICTLGFGILRLFNTLLTSYASSYSSSSSNLLSMSPVEYILKCREIEDDLRYYVSHRWRAKVQRNAFPFSCSRLQSSEAVVLIDYKMKVEPMMKDETQSEYFAKRGISLLGAAIYYKSIGSSDVKKQFFYCVGGQDSAQDAELTSHILFQLMKQLQSMGIKFLKLFSDGARTFQSKELLDRLLSINNFFDLQGLASIQLTEYSFAEAGEGKMEIDGRFAMITRCVSEYVKTVGPVTNAAELRKCLAVKLEKSTKHKLLLLENKEEYENLIQKHRIQPEPKDNIVLYKEDVGQFIFDLDGSSFSVYKRWIFFPKFAVLQRSTFEGMKAASLWQVTSKGWTNNTNPPTPIPRPNIRPIRTTPSKYRNIRKTRTTPSITAPKSSLKKKKNTTTTATATTSASSSLSSSTSSTSTSSVESDSGYFFRGMAHLYKKRSSKPYPIEQKNFMMNYIDNGGKIGKGDVRSAIASNLNIPLEEVISEKKIGAFITRYKKKILKNQKKN